MRSLRGILLLLPTLLSAATARAACPAAIPTTTFANDLALAQASYTELDVEGFRAAMARAHEDLPCLDEEIPPHLAAEMHRFEGLLAFLDRRSDRSTTAFAAARSIEPHYHFLDSFVPPGNPVLGDYSALNPDDGQTIVLAEPAEGRVVLDGRSSLARSGSFPTIFQLVSDSGEVQTTHYLWPEDPVPPYLERSVPITNQQRTRGSGAVAVVRTGPDRGLLTGAGLCTAAAALLYGGAFVVHQRYDNPDTGIEQLGGLRAANNTLVLASGASAGVALGLTTSAFLVARF